MCPISTAQAGEGIWVNPSPVFLLYPSSQNVVNFYLHGALSSKSYNTHFHCSVTKHQEMSYTNLTVFQDSPSSLEYCLSNWSNTTLHICFASFPSEFAFSYDDKKKLQTTHCDITDLLKFGINKTLILFFTAVFIR